MACHCFFKRRAAASLLNMRLNCFLFFRKFVPVLSWSLRYFATSLQVCSSNKSANFYSLKLFSHPCLFRFSVYFFAFFGISLRNSPPFLLPTLPKLRWSSVTQFFSTTDTAVALIKVSELVWPSAAVSCSFSFLASSIYVLSDKGYDSLHF